MISRGSVAPNTIPAVIARLRAWAAENRWSKTRFAAEAGLQDTTLRRFHESDWNPTREILCKLESVVPASWQIGQPVPVKPGPNQTGGKERHP